MLATGFKLNHSIDATAQIAFAHVKDDRFMGKALGHGRFSSLSGSFDSIRNVAHVDVPRSCMRRLISLPFPSAAKSRN
jgi:hypothetical protein